MREIERAFPPWSRGKIQRHAQLHTTWAQTRKKRVSARKGVGIGVDAEPREAPASPALQPIESAADVMSELQRLRIAADSLFRNAVDRSDWRQATNAFSSLLALTDKFGEAHKVFTKGANVSITFDQRSLRIEKFLDQLPIATLTALQRGEITIEDVTGGVTLDQQVGV